MTKARPFIKWVGGKHCIRPKREIYNTNKFSGFQQAITAKMKLNFGKSAWKYLKILGKIN